MGIYDAAGELASERIKRVVVIDIGGYGLVWSMFFAYDVLVSPCDREQVVIGIFGIITVR